MKTGRYYITATEISRPKNKYEFSAYIKESSKYWSRLSKLKCFSKDLPFKEEEILSLILVKNAPEPTFLIKNKEKFETMVIPPQGSKFYFYEVTLTPNGILDIFKNVFK